MLYFNLSPTREEKALVFCVRTDMAVMYCTYTFCDALTNIPTYASACLDMQRESEAFWVYQTTETPNSTALLPFLPELHSVDQQKNAFRFKSLHDKPFTLTITIPPLFSPADVSLKMEKGGWGEREREREERGWWTLYCIFVSY